MQKNNTPTPEKKINVRWLTTMGMLAAIGIVLVAFIEVPLFPAAPFLKYDPADIPILIGTMLYGPLSGVILTIIVSFVQSFMIHGSGGPIGFVMHVIATGAMTIVLGNIFMRSKKTRVNAAVALTFGALAMTIAMIGMNLVLTPIFMNTPIDAVLKILVPVIIPFNLIKAGINSVVTFVLYRFVKTLIGHDFSYPMGNS